MELSELTAYAEEKYGIREQHKWAAFPGFSVLCHPQTGKWVALLMRQWDTDTGTEIQRCDMRCGQENLLRLRRPYLSGPLRMRGDKWVGIAFDRRTEREVVFQLLDRAIASGNAQGVTIVLSTLSQDADHRYRETALPFAGSPRQPVQKQVPERLRRMRRLYSYGAESEEARAENFCRQAVFMADYEDDYPWTGDFFRYFPTYQDLDTRQLRGYFTWRAQVRRGDFRPIATSAAYIYLYELLNGVGASSPEDSLEKLRDFEAGYLDAGLGDARMRTNLHRWMLEFAVLQNLPAEQARQAMDPKLLERDEALSVLRAPNAHSDGEVFRALCFFGGKKTENSPVLKSDLQRGTHLFSASWRSACAYRRQGKDLFTLCFGRRKSRGWYPLSNAVYYVSEEPKTSDYILNDCRSFHYRNGSWSTRAYEKPSFDRDRFQSFLHGTDACLRRYLKIGRPLKETAADEWVLPYVEQILEADKKALLEASRRRITLDLSGLDRIRTDALVTRESLLTDEERGENGDIRNAALAAAENGDVRETAPDVAENGAVWESPAAAESGAVRESPAAAEEGGEIGLPLDSLQLRILRALLEGREVSSILRECRTTPALAADAINEALYGEFGDTVLLCENDRLLVVEDYLEDLKQYLGG